jgi:DNA polymerase-3 subunit delta'
MQQRLTTRPTLGGRRAIVVDPADDLEKGAANALLKSLEEPPVGGHFLLVAHRLGCPAADPLALPVLQFPRRGGNRCDPAPRARRPRARARRRSRGRGSPARRSVRRTRPWTARCARDRRARRSHFARRGRLAEAVGARPDHKRQFAAIDLARAVVAARMGTRRSAIPALRGPRRAQSAGRAALTFNFDAGLLVMEIGTLLASLAA